MTEKKSLSLCSNNRKQIPEPKQPLKILLVDDVDFTRMGLKIVLSECPSQFTIVGEASDGEEAVSWVQAAQGLEYFPDLILMDLGLPKLNGIDATRQIKTLFPDLPVLVLTASNDEENVIAALGAGANAYCLKDIYAEDLIRAILFVSQGVTWLAPSVAQVALKVFNQPAATSASDSQAANSSAYRLSEREYDVLKLMVEGQSNVDIAQQLWISANTVKAHVSTIMQKLLVNDRVQAAVKAVREGLV